MILMRSAFHLHRLFDGEFNGDVFMAFLSASL